MLVWKDVIFVACFVLDFLERETGIDGVVEGGRGGGAKGCQLDCLCFSSGA